MGRTGVRCCACSRGRRGASWRAIQNIRLAPANLSVTCRGREWSGRDPPRLSWPTVQQKCSLFVGVDGSLEADGEWVREFSSSRFRSKCRSDFVVSFACVSRPSARTRGAVRHCAYERYARDTGTLSPNSGPFRCDAYCAGRTRSAVPD